MLSLPEAAAYYAPLACQNMSEGLCGLLAVGYSANSVNPLCSMAFRCSLLTYYRTHSGKQLSGICLVSWSMDAQPHILALTLAC